MAIRGNNDKKVIKIVKRTEPDGADTVRTPITVKKTSITTTPYQPGRKDPDFIKEDTEDIKSYPENENKEKRAMRMQAQKEGKETYKFKGKEEYAGRPAKSDTTTTDSTYMKTEIKPKFKVVSDTSYVNSALDGKPKPKPTIVKREKAPGLSGGKNRLQQKY